MATQATVIVAAYKNGSFAGSRIETVSLKPGKTELAVTAPGEGDTYKIFLLSLSCTPLAEVWTGN